MIKVTKEELTKHLVEDCGLLSTDVVFLFSGMRGLGQMEKGPLGVLEVFESIVKEGALILPTFTYSWSKGENFSSLTSLNPDMGSIANLSIGRFGYIRTEHPNYSVNIYSRHPDIIKKIRPQGLDSFGSGSVFYNLYKEKPKTKILLLGGVFPDCAYRSTFIHTAQQLESAWYRYLQEVHDPQDNKQKLTQYVRFKSMDEFQRFGHPYKYGGGIKNSFPIVEDFNTYATDLAHEHLLKSIKLGYNSTRVVQVGASLDLFRLKIRQDPNYGLQR